MRELAKPAAIVGAVVLGYVILQEIIMIAWYISAIPVGQVGATLAGIGGIIALQALPFAVGVFVGAWLLSPFAAEMRFASVLKRSIVATALGAVLIVLIRTVVLSAGAFAGVGSFVGNSFPALPMGQLANEFGVALQSGVINFFQLLPLVMLTVILLRMWVARHPSRHAVSVDSAEV